jgi:hypothetical protein
MLRVLAGIHRRLSTPEQDEVAAGAQELLAGRRCLLHVCEHYRPRDGLAGAKGHALIFRLSV